MSDDNKKEDVPHDDIEKLSDALLAVIRLRFDEDPPAVAILALATVISTYAKLSEDPEAVFKHTLKTARYFFTGKRSPKPGPVGE